MALGVALAALVPAGAGAGAQGDAAPVLWCVAQTDGAAIDDILAKAGSPLAGEGGTFVSESIAEGIDPRFLVAIAAHETRLETYPPSRRIHNPFGLGPGMVFASDADAIARAARTLGRYYLPEGRTSIATIGPKWAPIGAANDPTGLNKNWVPGVGSRYAALGGDPTRPILTGAQASGAACPEPRDASLVVEAGGSSSAAVLTTWGGAGLMLLVVVLLARAQRARQTPEDEGPLSAAEVLAAHAEAAATMVAPEPRETAAPEDDPGAPEAIDTPEPEAIPSPPIPRFDPLLAWFAPVTPPPARIEADVDATSVTALEPLAEPEPEPEPEPLAEPDLEIEAELEPDHAAAVGGEPEGEPEAAPAPIVFDLEDRLGAEFDAEPEPEPAYVPSVEEQAVEVADLLPALLDGLVPFARICDRPDVTPRMLALIQIVADTPLSVTEQARVLGISRPAAAELSARLEGLGLARHEAVGNDLGRIRLALTDEGYALYADTTLSPEPADLEVVLERMDPTERAQLLAGLNAFRESLGG